MLSNNYPKKISDFIKREFAIKELMGSIKDEFKHYLGTAPLKLKGRALTPIEYKKRENFLNNIKESKTDYTFDEFYAEITEILVYFREQDIETVATDHEFSHFKTLLNCYSILNKVGFQNIANQPLFFWSGQIAKKRLSDPDLPGFCDLDIPAIVLMYELNNLIEKKEKRNAIQYVQNSLAKLNTAVYASQAFGTVTFYSGPPKRSEKATIPVHNYFWLIELPIIQKKIFKKEIKELNIYFWRYDRWSRPININAAGLTRRNTYVGPLGSSLSDENPERFEAKNSISSSRSEYDAWTQTDARPQFLYVGKLKKLTTHWIAFAKQKTISSEDLENLRNLNTPIYDHYFSMTSVKGRYLLMSMIILNDNYSILRQVPSFINHYLAVPTFLATHKKKLLENRTYAKNTYKALLILKEANQINDDSLDLIFSFPEKAVILSQAYVKTMQKLPQTSPFLFHGGIDAILFWHRIRELLIFYPALAPDLINAYRDFCIRTLFLDEAVKEMIFKIILLEEIALQGKLFLEICESWCGVELTQESKEEKSDHDLIKLKGQYQLQSWSLLSKENISQLIFYSDYLPRLHSYFTTLKPNQKMSQDFIDAVFADCLTAHELNLKSLPLTEYKAQGKFQSEVVWVNELVKDIQILIKFDPKRPSEWPAYIAKLESYYGKVAAKCFTELSRGCHFIAYLDNDTKKKIIQKIRYADCLLPALEYLNSGVQSMMGSSLIDSILENPENALAIAKASARSTLLDKAFMFFNKAMDKPDHVSLAEHVVSLIR